MESNSVSGTTVPFSILELESVGARNVSYNGFNNAEFLIKADTNLTIPAGLDSKNFFIKPPDDKVQLTNPSTLFSYL